MVTDAARQIQLAFEWIVADGMEHNVQIAGGTNRGEDAPDIKAVRSEVVQDSAPILEQWLDVD
jgi:hypothetical protein